MFWSAGCGCGARTPAPLLDATTRCGTCLTTIARTTVMSDGDVARMLARILTGDRVAAPPPPGHAPFVMPHDEPIAALLRAHGYLLCPACTGLTITGHRLDGVDTLNTDAAGPADGIRCRIHTRTVAERWADTQAAIR
jgi:hypothetical protein